MTLGEKKKSIEVKLWKKLNPKSAEEVIQIRVMADEMVGKK